MIRAILFACLINLPFLGKSQNHLANWSFELEDPGEPSNMPINRGQADKIEGWTSRVKCYEQGESGGWDHKPNCDDLPLPQTGNPIERRVHSPDWISTLDGSQHLKELPADVRVEPPTGDKFVGMGVGELLQHDFYSGEDLTPGETYFLSFKFRLFDGEVYHTSAIQSLQAGDMVGTEYYEGNYALNAYLSTKQIKYVKDGADERCGDIGVSDYIQKKNPPDQNIITIGSVNLSENVHGIGTWQETVIEFTAPENFGLTGLYSYEFFALELVGLGSNACDGYVGIDDVSISECDPHSCSQTSGEIYPIFPNDHYENLPFKVDNISNISGMHIQINKLPDAQEIYNEIVICNGGISEGWEWSGKTDFGDEAAIANYRLRLVLMNDCGSDVVMTEFHKHNTVDTQPVSNQSNCDAAAYVPPLLCCPFSQDLYIDNENWSNQEFELHAQNGLYVAQDDPVIVNVGSTVEFKAGQIIEFNPGFSSQNGGQFTAEIVPCPVLRVADPTLGSFSGSSWSIAENVNNLKDQEAVAETLVAVPNPSNGSFELIGTQEMYSVVVMNASGYQIQAQQVFSKTRSGLTGLPSGFYIVQVYYTDGSWDSVRVVVK